MKTEIERINEISELKGQIIDIFEDFLEEKGIDIPNPEKEEDADDPAIIYGSDYDLIGDKLEHLIENWKLV